MLSLASTSKIRSQILKAAKIPFQIVSGSVDEHGIQRDLSANGSSYYDIVYALADAKARQGASNTNGLVLGCDQVLVFNGQIFGKPNSPDDLYKMFNILCGKPHELLTANVVYQNGKAIWHHVGRVKLTMRALSDTEISHYVEKNWDHAQYCAGGYSVENTPYLFSDIEGDWFDILGLSLDPLCKLLENNGIKGIDHPKLAGVVGHPIHHSKSPKLHGYWLESLNISGFYTAIECPPQYFNDTMNLLYKMGFSGVNVTIPHKETALALSHTQTPAAKAIGASNTLVFTIDGIHADNTDGVGFWQNIKQSLPDFDIRGKTACVLGAGGAARAIIWSLLDAGASQVMLTNRTQKKSQELADLFGEKIIVVDWEMRSDILMNVDFLVNTTALGMEGQPSLDISLDLLKNTSVVTDIVYVPMETDLLAAAKAKGCPTVDGLGMLLHQAVPGFDAWFKMHPMVDDGLRQAVLS